MGWGFIGFNFGFANQCATFFNFGSGNIALGFANIGIGLANIGIGFACIGFGLQCFSTLRGIIAKKSKKNVDLYT